MRNRIEQKIAKHSQARLVFCLIMWHCIIKMYMNLMHLKEITVKLCCKHIAQGHETYNLVLSISIHIEILKLTYSEKQGMLA